jgi:hypothetical protein
MEFSLITAVLIALLLPACGIVGYGPPQDHSAFVSTAATTDGAFGVFSHHRYVYRAATGMNAFPDGGIPRYDKDTDTLGVYEFATGKVRIVRSEENTYWQHGQGTFSITMTSNKKAVISQGGQRRSDSQMELRQYMLDIPSGEMNPLNIKDELDKIGRAPGYMYLVDDAGTLVLVTAPRGERPDWVGVEANPKEVWIRHPDGSYEKAATVVHYYPTRDGLVHYFDFDQKKYLVYDPAAHESRTPPERYPPTWYTNKVYNLTVSPDDRNKLSVVVWNGGDWKYKDAGVSGEGLY